MTDLLLEVTGIAKRYGAVTALRDASLAVRSGEIHALMGANGAGKSTLVKILTGAVRPNAGTILVRGQARDLSSPSAARRSGVVSVYQEPALIPDLDIVSNLRLTDTPIEPFRSFLVELGVSDLSLRALPRAMPLAVVRIVDLARALAQAPDILLLDEITAALPADLTERVLEVVGRQRASGRSVIFISHRLLEIAAVCDRATVLRDGVTVGTVDMEAGAADRIVTMMLGPSGGAPAAAGVAAAAASRPDQPPQLEARGVGAGSKLKDVSFALHAGEVLGLVALEGQGQDELFSVLAGSLRPDAGEVLVDGQPVHFGHPADAIRAGVVFVPANRAEALLGQRSVRENIALPRSARVTAWGPIRMGQEKQAVDASIARLQIDTRAQSEVRRLSGGNQQKVTIARWIAGGVRTLLLFDPTRGIDIRTKREIYQLVRELAAAGAAVLLFTSELAEIQAACDRVVVIFGGRVVDERAAAGADESTLTRAAYGLPPGTPAPEEVAAAEVAADPDAKPAQVPS